MIQCSSKVVLKDKLVVFITTITWCQNCWTPEAIVPKQQIGLAAKWNTKQQ